VELDEHLFRRESGRMVAALTRIFGVHNLALAEDVVQDSFCRALEVWKFRGMPDNPSAWLMATAKNRALDVLRRERTARTPLRTENAFPPIRSTSQRWANSSCGVEIGIPRVRTSWPRLPWRAIQWSVGSSISALRRAIEWNRALPVNSR